MSSEKNSIKIIKGRGRYDPTFKFVQLQLLERIKKKFTSFYRRVINPDADWSSEDAEIKLFVIQL